jgi:jumonji domain-containing protein 7
MSHSHSPFPNIPSSHPPDLITTYHDLNPSTITELLSEPSPLEFMRHVSRNRPFVVRGGASSWPACQKWNAGYLCDVMGDSPVNVAITPHGNADSIIRLGKEGEDGGEGEGEGEEEQMLFVKPFETQEPFCEALAAIQSQSHLSQSPSPSPSTAPTRYLQTQNDNLRTEYISLFSDVPASIPFARIALDQSPDAINFWLGNDASVTALHKDNYENIYVQVLGKKHFVLLPPVESVCVGERGVLGATYMPRPRAGMGIGNSDTASGSGSGSGSGSDPREDFSQLTAADLIPTIDTPPTYTPFATWDPDTSSPSSSSSPSFPTKHTPLSRPLRITLDPGDMLYLPALWYHKVSQSCSEEGICCAVNYWYDVEFSGGFWSMAGFVRGVGLLSLRDSPDRAGTKDDEQSGTRPREESGIVDGTGGTGTGTEEDEEDTTIPTRKS